MSNDAVEGCVDPVETKLLTAARARRLRVLTWTMLPLMAALYFFVLQSGIEPKGRLLILELIYCTPVTITVGLGWIAHRRSESNERVFWAALSIANGVLIACELLLIYWVFALNPAGPPRVSWPFHGLHAIAAASFIVALASLSRVYRMPLTAQLRGAIDITSIMIIAEVLLLNLYVRPIMEPAGASPLQVLLGTAYPAFAFLMVLGALVNLVGFKVDVWRTWDRLVIMSLAIYALAISVWPLWFTTAVSTSRNYERGVLDLVQFAGHWLLMSAAVYRLTEVDSWKMRPLAAYVPRRRWANAFAPLLGVVGIVVVCVAIYAANREFPWFEMYLALFGVLVLFAIARSALVAFEMARQGDTEITDALTGLHNRSYFHDRLADEIEHARRYERSMSIVAVDLDDFGEITKRVGRAESERLLRQVGEILLKACHSSCTMARLGADNFAILVPDKGPREAVVLARKLIDRISISSGSVPGELTASAGVASFPEHASRADELLHAAEAAMYHAKASGAGSLSCYEDDYSIDALGLTERNKRLERVL